MKISYERTPEIKEKMKKAALEFYQKNPSPRIGIKHSFEARQKISIAMRRYCQKLKKEGRFHPAKGHQTSEIQRQKQSKAMKGKYAGSNNPAWKGGRKKSLGYIYILCPGHPGANSQGYIREHRLVMEKMIRRPLVPGEIVHHINGIKTDNRPENLRLFKSNEAHSDFHRICPHCGKRI